MVEVSLGAESKGLTVYITNTGHSLLTTMCHSLPRNALCQKLLTARTANHS